MMIPEFIRFYSYTASDVLDELAVRFFSLMNSMYRIKATESLDRIAEASVAQGSENGKSYVSELQKQSKGLHGIIEEVRVIKPRRTK